MTTNTVRKSAFQQLDKLVLLKQTFFGLPWMISAGILPFAQKNTPDFNFITWGLMLVAFFSARTSGMCFNRLIDCDIDAQNPRTKNRALPRGEVSRDFCALLAGAFLLLFLFAALCLGLECFLLAVVAALLLVAYSFTKRYTIGCHFVLGLVHMLSVFCSWSAVNGTLSEPAIALGLAVFCVISGSDIIYACQDIDFDKKANLQSVPAFFGEKNALVFAAGLHVLAIGCLVWTADCIVARSFFCIGVASIGAILGFIHWQLHAKIASFEQSFIRANLFSSFVLLFFTAGEAACRAFA